MLNETPAPESSFLDVNIHGREYRVSCAPGEREALESAVRLVDQQMAGVAAQSKTATPERVAVMAALHIAHELLTLKRDHQEIFDMAAARRRIAGMEARLDGLLADAHE